MDTKQKSAGEANAIEGLSSKANSKVFSVRVPAALAGRIDAMAAARGMTASAYIAACLDDYLAAGVRNETLFRLEKATAELIGQVNALPGKIKSELTKLHDAVTEAMVTE